MQWLKAFKVDPIPSLLAVDDPALTYHVYADLLDETADGVETLWKLSTPRQILEKQRGDGGWDYPSRNAHPFENYRLLQTYRMLGILIEQYGFHRQHPSISAAAGYLFAHQTDEGDIRGIFGAQYMPHYCAGLFELLIKAGFAEDPHVARGFDWFDSMRQVDGGWAWPLRTTAIRYEEAREREAPIQPDRARPFAHALTGFVLRMYAAHPTRRTSVVAHHAGALMTSRFFQKDAYPDRREAECWLKFQFPFWWSNLLTTLDSLGAMGFSPDDENMARGLRWFLNNQESDGLWPTGYDKGEKAKKAKPWVALAVCRMIKQFF